MRKFGEVIYNIISWIVAIIGGLLTPLLIIFAIMGFGDSLVNGYKKNHTRRR